MMSMPRKVRDLLPDSVHHVISRGVERRSIFQKAEDYAFFLTQAREAFELAGIALLNYVLMPNHFHFQLILGPTPLGEAMQQLLTRHSLYFNRSYGRVGHLFQGRYKQFECADDDYLVDLPVYISKNPTRARLASNAAEWEWSGHNELVSGRRRYLNIAALDRLGGISAERWRAAYLERFAHGDPVLPTAPDLSQILRRAALLKGVPESGLRAGHQGPAYIGAKSVFIDEAFHHGYTQQDVAEALGCSTQAVKYLRRTRKRGTHL